jgi:hypothetical protein
MDLAGSSAERAVLAIRSQNLDGSTGEVGSDVGEHLSSDIADGCCKEVDKNTNSVQSA